MNDARWIVEILIGLLGILVAVLVYLSSKMKNLATASKEQGKILNEIATLTELIKDIKTDFKLQNQKCVDHAIKNAKFEEILTNHEIRIGKLEKRRI